MRKIKCYCHNGFAGEMKEGIVEIEDNATEEDIEQEFQDWVNNNIDMGWYEIKEEVINP